ncbi:hypothetical protein HDU83_004101 [Entophlyctis luteolus]|nr:hypothetical protein HDU83_004101 [Entophlyctis luteolus]
MEAELQGVKALLSKSQQSAEEERELMRTQFSREIERLRTELEFKSFELDNAAEVTKNTLKTNSPMRSVRKMESAKIPHFDTDQFSHSDQSRHREMLDIDFSDVTQAASDAAHHQQHVLPGLDKPSMTVRPLENEIKNRTSIALRLLRNFTPSGAATSSRQLMGIPGSDLFMKQLSYATLNPEAPLSTLLPLMNSMLIQSVELASFESGLVLMKGVEILTSDPESCKLMLPDIFKMKKDSGRFLLESPLSMLFQIFLGAAKTESKPSCVNSLVATMMNVLSNLVFEAKDLKMFELLG